MTISMRTSLPVHWTQKSSASLHWDIQYYFFYGVKGEGKGKQGVICCSMFCRILEKLVGRDFHRSSSETCCCRWDRYQPRSGQPQLCLSMTWKLPRMGIVLLLWVTCSSEKVFPTVQSKMLKPCLYGHCPFYCAWQYWGESGSASLVSVLCTITGCCSSPLLTRLSKLAPQPLLAWCSRPRTSWSSSAPPLQFLNILLQIGDPKPKCPLSLFPYVHVRLFWKLFENWTCQWIFGRMRLITHCHRLRGWSHGVSSSLMSLSVHGWFGLLLVNEIREQQPFSWQI